MKKNCVLLILLLCPVIVASVENVEDVFVSEQQCAESKKNKTIYEIGLEKGTVVKKYFDAVPSMYKKIVIAMIIAGIVKVALSHWLKDVKYQEEEVLNALSLQEQALRDGADQAKMLALLVDLD